MNKQEAIRFIHELLEQAHNQDEIVRLLADQLRAPQDLVKKFVAQAATDYHNEKARQAEESKPTWLRQLQNSATIPAQPTILAETHQPPPSSTPRIQLPPWLQENGFSGVSRNRAASSLTSWQRDMHDYVLQQLEIGRTYGDIADDVALRAGVVPPLARQFVREVDLERREQQENTNPKPAHPPSHNPEDIPLQVGNIAPGWDRPPPTRDPLKDPQMLAFALDELGHRRKRADVVMAVCERTHLPWDQAERVVAQAAIQKQSQGAAQTHEALMFVGILAAVGGFVLAAIYGLPMFAELSKPMNWRLHLPFQGEFVTRQPGLAVGFFIGGMILVGFGAAMAYLYYHAAEEYEA